MLDELKTQMAFVCQELLPHISYDTRLTAELKTLRDMVMSIDTADFGMPKDDNQDKHDQE